MGEGASVSSEDLLADSPDAMAFEIDEFTEDSIVRPLGDGRSILTGLVHDGQNFHLTMALFDRFGERDLSFGNHGILQILLSGGLRQFRQLIWRPDNRIWLLRTPAPSEDDE